MQEFEIGIADEFEAAHSLSGDFGPATRLHGHTYKVEVSISAKDIDSGGTFFDLGRLRSELRAVLAPLHYRNLNDLPEFFEINTTAETLACYVLKKLSPVVRPGAEGIKVTVWESTSSWASCRESFDD